MSNKAAQTVTKANALIEAGHRLSLSEQRVVLAAITQMRQDEMPDSRRWYSVDAESLAAVAGLDLSNIYDDLVRTIERLYERDIVIRGGPNGTAHTTARGQPEVMRTRWVQAIRYVPGEGRIEVMFSELIIPYLAQLWTQFTQYQLEHVAPMSSRFGPRLYELLAQWRQVGRREVSIEWLRESWGVQGYTRIDNLKRRVINPAIRDVNEHSDLQVRVHYRKTGRKVTHAQFEFWAKSQGTKRSRRETAVQHEKAEQAHQQRLEQSRQKGSQELAELMREHGLEPPEDLH